MSMHYNAKQMAEGVTLLDDKEHENILSNMEDHRPYLQELARDFFRLVDKDTIHKVLWEGKEDPPLHIVRLRQFALWLAEMEDFKN